MRRLPFFFALLAGAAAAHAADKPLYQPAPEWIVPAPPIDAAALTDSAPMVVLLDNQQRIGDDGQVWSFYDSATRATSAQTLGNIGNVQLVWQPAQGDLVIHKAEIIRGAQHIDLVRGGQPFTVLRREQQLEQRELDGMLTATMNAEGLAIGDVLHVSFSITRRDPTLKGAAQTFAPLPAAPGRIGFGRIRLLWPEKTDLKWRVDADGVDARPVTAKGWRALTIALPVAKQPEIPNDAPARFKKLSVVEASTFADWAAVSKVMAPLYATDGLIAPGGPLAAEVARIKAAESDPLKRAALALQLVQDKVRYLMLGMDTGNYVPQAPAQTWERRYGDCKAKTLLLLALLHALDIAAEPVTASVKLTDLVPARLPSPGAFDHVLVHATIAGESLWLDGTGSGTRLADIRDTPPFGMVLPLRAAGAALLPIAMRANARADVTFDIVLDDSAGLMLPTVFHATVTARGGVAEAIGAGSAQATAEQRADLVRKILTDQIGEVQVVDPAIAYDPAAGVVTITASGLVTTRWGRSDQRYRQPLDRAVNAVSFDPDRARAAWRAIPVAVPGPGTQVFRTTLKLPDGGTGFALEGDRTLPATLAGVQLTRRVTLAGATVTLEDRVAQLGGEIAPEQIAPTRLALSQAQGRLLRVAAPADYPARVEVVRRAQANGGLKAIDAMYARIIAADPKEATIYTSRASLRTGIYDRAGAVADYTRAIGIEATADLYLKRADLYRLLGQDAKSRADIDAARRLDPDSDDALRMLAWHRSRHGDPAGGLALLQERVDVAGKDDQGWTREKASMLADQGKASDAIALLDTALKDKPGDPALLNERCWIKGTMNVAVDSALKDCTKAIELADGPAAALDSRAMAYFRMNKLDDAVADLDAALDAAPSLSSSLFLRGVIRRREGKTADGDADIATARQINPLVDRDYKAWGIAP